MNFRVEGIIPAMVTPFTKNGEFVDLDRVGPLAQMLVKGGAGGLFVCGTTGEGHLMSADERKEVLEEVVAAVGKKAKIIAQTGCLDTATTLELTRHAQACGAHAVAVVTPAYYGYDDISLTRFYKDVAGCVKNFPVLLYNIPGCAKNSISPELAVKLANSIENIVGTKDSSGNMIALTQLLANAPKGFNVINGVDEYCYQAFCCGTKAAVSGPANFVLDLHVGIHKNFVKGNLKKAWETQAKLTNACGVFQYGRRLSLFKEGMRLRGFDPGYVRPPQLELTAAEKKQLAKEMEALGLI